MPYKLQEKPPVRMFDSIQTETTGPRSLKTLVRTYERGRNQSYFQYPMSPVEHVFSYSGMPKINLEESEKVGLVLHLDDNFKWTLTSIPSR